MWWVLYCTNCLVLGLLGVVSDLCASYVFCVLRLVVVILNLTCYCFWWFAACVWLRMLDANLDWFDIGCDLRYCYCLLITLGLRLLVLDDNVVFWFWCYCNWVVLFGLAIVRRSWFGLILLLLTMCFGCWVLDMGVYYWRGLFVFTLLVVLFLIIICYVLFVLCVWCLYFGLACCLCLVIDWCALCCWFLLILCFVFMFLFWLLYVWLFICFVC